MTWIVLWKVMFVVVMLVFAVMACLVTVLGAKDIRKLLKALGEDEKQHSRYRTPRRSKK